MSSTVHWRRNPSAVMSGWSSGVRALWKAYRWLMNISPGGPRAFFFSKLKTWATPSNTIASSPITGRPPWGGAGRAGGAGPCRRAGRAARGPPRPGGAPPPLGDLPDRVGRERAPAGGQQQLHLGPLAVQVDPPDQA